MGRIGVVVLAAGKGTRMRSRLPKVTHSVGGRAMLEHVLRAATEAVAVGEWPERDGAGDAEEHSPRFVVVVGHERERVRALVTWAPPAGAVEYVEQEPQLGTGDAAKYARPALTGSEDAPDAILVLYGDTPLVRPETLRALLDEHARSGATLTFLTGIADDPTGYGRVLRDAAGRVRGVVEQKHATAEEQTIREMNSGIYCFDAGWLWSRLDGLERHENGEYYLTDLVDVAVREGRPVSTASAALEETMGVNDRVQLAEAERILRGRVLRELMLSGVTVEDPATTYVETGVRVGQDTLLRPGTTLRGATVIGERCEIGPYSVIQDSEIGDECQVYGSWLERAVMEPGARVGPMSRLRPGARLKRGAHVGNFGEVKNATVGEDVQMHHFSYVGDATVGAGTNIGAGVITMNYDGVRKHHTEIGARAFVGSDTLLRAPVSIGDGAATGGGAVVTRDVPPGSLAVGMPARLIRRVRSTKAGDAGDDAAARADAENAGDEGMSSGHGTESGNSGSEERE